MQKFKDIKLHPNCTHCGSTNTNQVTNIDYTQFHCNGCDRNFTYYKPQFN